MPSVLILCPTFDHTETLFASTASVRAQRFTDWELVVIGDGAPGRTTAIMAAISGSDSRIRYESHPKSERYGESYRDRIIRESCAEVILQLGDDDLWAPDHVDCMLDLLQGADWSNQAPLRVAADGTAEWWPINHGTTAIRSSIVGGVPVSAGPNFVAYRREAYLRLPEGWTCAPRTGPSDAFMWAKFFRLPLLKVASTAATTAVKFPSHVAGREHLTAEQRRAELQPWLPRMSQPGFVRNLCAGASIYSRMLALYSIHQTSATDSWKDAMHQCGLQPAPAETQPRLAENGEAMLLPLSPAQERQAELAWEEYKRTSAN
jgi:hypothetical protein